MTSLQLGGETTTGGDPTLNEIIDYVQEPAVGGQVDVDPGPPAGLEEPGEHGLDVLTIDVYKLMDDTDYKNFRVALEKLLKIVANATRDIVDRDTFRDMIFEFAMPYVKRDIGRLQTYAILDDVVRFLF